MSDASLPSSGEIVQMNADAMARLLASQDLRAASLSWWMVVVSTCNSGLLGAEAGLEDADRWAELLITALDLGEQLGMLPREETIQRRIICSAAALRYFGVQKGSLARDPELSFKRLVVAAGCSRDQVLVGLEAAMQELRYDPTDVGYYRKVKWFTGIKKALCAACEIIPFMDSVTAAEASEWCRIAPQMSFEAS